MEPPDPYLATSWWWPQASRGGSRIGHAHPRRHPVVPGHWGRSAGRQPRWRGRPSPRRLRTRRRAPSAGASHRSEELAVSIAIALIAPKILGQAGVSCQQASTARRHRGTAGSRRLSGGLFNGGRGAPARSSGSRVLFRCMDRQPRGGPTIHQGRCRSGPSHWCTYDGRRSS